MLLAAPGSSWQLLAAPGVTISRTPGVYPYARSANRDEWADPNGKPYALANKYILLVYWAARLFHRVALDRVLKHPKPARRR